MTNFEREKLSLNSIRFRVVFLDQFDRSTNYSAHINANFYLNSLYTSKLSSQTFYVKSTGTNPKAIFIFLQKISLKNLKTIFLKNANILHTKCRNQRFKTLLQKNVVILNLGTP